MEAEKTTVTFAEPQSEGSDEKKEEKVDAEEEEDQEDEALVEALLREKEFDPILRMEAIWDWEPKIEVAGVPQLSFKKGAHILVERKDSSGWWWGILDDEAGEEGEETKKAEKAKAKKKQGMVASFPANYAKIVEEYVKSNGEGVAEKKEEGKMTLRLAKKRKNGVLALQKRLGFINSMEFTQSGGDRGHLHHLDYLLQLEAKKEEERKEKKEEAKKEEDGLEKRVKEEKKRRNRRRRWR
ncbi:hypothetical protein QOT17_005413 [Balamuthia mandrillaris]